MIGFDIKRLTPLIYVTSVLILLLVTFRLMVFLLPFLIATIIVSITNPVARFISEKTKMKKNIAKFDAESYGKGYANGDLWVVQGYPDNIY